MSRRKFPGGEDLLNVTPFNLGNPCVCGHPAPLHVVAGADEATCRGVVYRDGIRRPPHPCRCTTFQTRKG